MENNIFTLKKLHLLKCIRTKKGKVVKGKVKMETR